MRRISSFVLVLIGASCLSSEKQPAPPPASETAKGPAVSVPASSAAPTSAPVAEKKAFDPNNPCANVNQEPAPSGPEAEAKLQKLSEELTPIVETTRQVKAGKPVKMEWTSHIQVCNYATEEINKQISAEEILGQEVSNKVWGLIPEDMDLKNTMLALFTEQAAGFYDPRTKTLYVADWLPDAIKKPALAHEMYHGIQDQTIDLKTVLFEAKNDDTKSARQSLFEGDGTLVMTLASLPKVDIKALAGRLMPMLPMMRAAGKAESAKMPIFASSPKSLQESLLFPYLSGLEFVMYGAGQSGDFSLLDEAYQNLPESTEQIMHPEKFFTKKKDVPSPIVLPEALSIPEGFQKVYENTMGEFVFRMIVGESDPFSKKAESAIGWDGDSYRAYMNGKKLAVVAVLAYDDDKSAEAMKTALASTFPDAFVSVNKKTISFVRGFGTDNEKIAKELSSSKITWK
jgi:hypothetical protein